MKNKIIILGILSLVFLLITSTAAIAVKVGELCGTPGAKSGCCVCSGAYYWAGDDLQCRPGICGTYCSCTTAVPEFTTVGIVVGIVIIAGAIYLLYKKKKK